MIGTKVWVPAEKTRNVFIRKTVHFGGAQKGLVEMTAGGLRQVCVHASEAAGSLCNVGPHSAHSSHSY